jgi:hypothetical protein
LEGHEGSEEGADKGNKAVEHGNSAGDYIGNYGYSEGAGEPCCPVDWGVGG